MSSRHDDTAKQLPSVDRTLSYAVERTSSNIEQERQHRKSQEDRHQRHQQQTRTGTPSPGLDPNAIAIAG